MINNNATLKGAYMKNVTTIREYLVTNRNTGGVYLTERKQRTIESGKYRWAKSKTNAVLMTYDAAQKARQRYGGSLVRVTTVITQEPV